GTIPCFSCGLLSRVASEDTTFKNTVSISCCRQLVRTGFRFASFLIVRQLPVSQPGQLVELLKQYPGDPRLNSFSKGEYRYIRDRNDVFSGLIASSTNRVAVRGEDGGTETVDTESVSESYFPVLGVKPVLGRLIGPEDGRAGSDSVPV